MCAPPEFRVDVPLLLSQSAVLDRGAVRFVRISAFLCASAVLVIGILDLTGWAVGWSWSTTRGAPGPAMNAVTAVCLILLSSGLLLTLPQPGSAFERATGKALAAAAALLAVATLAARGSSSGPDAWLLRDAVGGAAPVSRMAPGTALALAVLGCAACFLDAKIRGRVRPAQLAAIAALLVTSLVAVGLLFDVTEFHAWGARTPLPRDTTAALLLIELAILGGRVEHGATRIFVTRGAGGLTARRLAPAAVLLPLLLGYLRLAGQRAGLYGAEFGVVIFSLSMSAVFALLVWWTARSVERIDNARTDVDARLQALIRHTPLGIVVLDVEGRVQLCNDAFVEIFHYSQPELLGRRVDDSDRAARRRRRGRGAHAARSRRRERPPLRGAPSA